MDCYAEIREHSAGIISFANKAAVLGVDSRAPIASQMVVDVLTKWLADRERLIDGLVRS